MRTATLFTLISLTCFLCISCKQKGKPGPGEGQRILKVPSEFSTIAEAVKGSEDGDWIIISPGTYKEHDIEINRSVTISSEWRLMGDESKIEQTIIDAEDQILFTIVSDGVEVSGLHLINGDHTLNIEAKASVLHNHFVNNLDAMSFEGSGGGYVGYNLVENDRDDGLDVDIRFGGDNRGSNILVEHNTIINSNDDGIEIRLYDYADQNINYILRDNTIIGSKNAGIQIISYDIFTGKEFHIHHNIIRDCKTGLGCMEGTNTREDLSGASTMDERIWFFNNTLTGNQMGATGGNNVIAVNNVVMGNSLGGFKMFGKSSAVINNLFYQNGGEDFIACNESVVKSGNIFSVDPLLDRESFAPAANSPCIDAGIANYQVADNTTLEVPSKYITGSAPDLGAVELNAKSNTCFPERGH